MLAPLLLILAPLSSLPAQPPHHLRSLRDIPFPKTLDAAKSLHAEAMRRCKVHTSNLPKMLPILPIITLI